MTDLALVFVVFFLLCYVAAREYLYHQQIKFLTKLASGDPHPDVSGKVPEPANPIAKEEPNEIPITEDHPFVLPKEFNLEVEGQEPRSVKLE